jgi:hypothetical protein
MAEVFTNDSQKRAKLILDASVSSSSISWTATVTDGNASYGGWGLAGATLTVNVNGARQLTESNRSYDFGGNTGSDTVVANAFFPRAGKTFTGTVGGLSASTSYNVNATFGTTGNVGTATISFNVTTSAPPAPPAPTWQATSAFTATRGTAFSTTVTASPVTGYSLVSQSADTRGLSLGGALGNVISGTPTSVGTVTFTIRATNSGTTSNKTFTITINPALPVFSDASVNNLATLNIAYSDSVAASETTSYSVRNPDTPSLAGALPPGLNLNTSTGAITGAPTTIGNTSFRLRATNVTGSTDTEILTIQVRNNLGKRRTSSGFENIQTARRFNGTAWVATTVSKRFNGTAWVDISNS